MSTAPADPTLVQFLAPDAAWDRYRAVLIAALAEAGVAANLGRDHAPAQVDYIIYAPGGALVDFATYPRARAVLSLWAGVESILLSPGLTQPLARLVDDGLSQGMVEWVAAHVLRHHLNTDTDVLCPPGLWRPRQSRLAPDRPVTILGLGELGRAVARALIALGFPVSGWSRSPRAVAGLTAGFHGPQGLGPALSGAEILILLLPRTPDTENILNARTLALLPRGAVILNPGRGALIDDAALLAALDSGQIGAATLDVFRTEPLPPDHPYWTHPRVTVTPHIAAFTDPASAARVTAANIARAEKGEPLHNLVDRARGY